jgi:hypothetical protein
MQQNPQTPLSSTPTEDFYSFFTKKIFSTGEGSFLDTALKSLIPDAKTILNTFQEVDSEAMKVAKSFGQGRENVLGIKQTLVDAAPAIEALGGKFDDVGKIQTSLVSNLNRAVLLSTDAYSKIYATTEVTGKKADELLPAFKNVGVSAYGVAEGMQKIVDVARQQGLSVQAVSSQAVANMEAMNKYTFQGGVDGLAKMAAQASSLRIDMKTALNFADNLYKPEKAIEMAAALQRLGVTQSELLDPLRLMDLSINDPAELQNQLVQMTQQFVTMGEAGNFEIAPEGKLRMRELAEAMNMPYEQLTKMALGSAELEDKLTKIRFPDFMSDDQQKMIANLAEMKDGEYVINVGGDEVKLADALENLTGTEDFDALMKSMEPKTMEELASEQLDLQKSMEASLRKISGRTPRALASSKTGEEAAGALRGGVKGITDAMTDRGVMSSKSIRDLVDEQAENVGEMLTKLFQGDDNVFGNLSDMGESFKEFGTTTLDGLKANLQEQYTKMSESQNAYAKVSTSLIEKIDGLIESQTGYKILSNAKSTADENIEKSTNENKNSNNQQQSTVNTSSTVDVNIKLEVPPGMSNSDVMEALRTEEIKQEIVKIIESKHPDMKTKPN